ncbi:MAG TPA: chromosome segregation protein SMC [Syntrophomonadaceae bacterium]|nr:chromosome segregation protein SMC [Syntrophomonadaceae bacterium]
MFLKRLDIKGFKSFAEDTEIVLNPGINIIVGPNGCGKSNIVDAVRWVLGEINVRHLRGQKGEDVIFHGSDRKRSQGMASVELTLDNSQKLLPLDFNEITLGRKVFRSGESEFFLNKSRVRMKDIAALFTGTGVGRKGYSIISQGELEQVLNGQAMDRRLMLEEASGIIRYRQQRDEVKQRIQASANDLLRLNDILAELGQRKNELGRKAEKASAYQVLSTRLEEQERKLLLEEISHIKARLDPQRQASSSEQEQLQVLLQSLQEREESLRQEEEQLQDTMLSYKELREAKHQAEAQLAALETEIRLAQERIKNCGERCQTAERDEEKYRSMLDNFSRELEERQADFQSQQANYLDKVEEMRGLEQVIADEKEHLQAARQGMEEAKAAIFSKVQAETNLHNQVKKSEESLRRSGDRKERLNHTAGELSERLRVNTQEGRHGLEEKARRDAQYQTLEAQVNNLEYRRQELEAELKGLDDAYRKEGEEASLIESRLAVIRTMERDLTGYSQAVKQLMRAEKEGRFPGMLGLMGEIITVPPGLELAMEVAVGKGLENVVMEKMEQARTAIEWLKQRRAGRITFLPLDSLKVQKVPPSVLEQCQGQKGVLGLGSQLVTFDSRFEKAVEYLLGRVLVVEDAQQAIRLFKGLHYSLRIVSLEGEAINLAGAISGGTRASQENSPLQRKGEEKRLLSQYEQKQKLRDKNRQVRSRLASQLEELLHDLQIVKDQFVESRLRNEMLGKQLLDLEKERRLFEEERFRTLQSLDELDHEITSLEGELAELQERAQTVQDESQSMSKNLEEMREQMETLQRDHEVKKERLHSFREQLGMKEKELETARGNIQQFTQVRNSYQQSCQQAASLRNKLDEEIIREQDRIEAMENDVEIAGAGLQVLALELQELEEQDKTRRSRVARMRREMGPVKQDISTREIRLRELEMSIARAETELDGASRKWREKYHSPPPSPAETLATSSEISELEQDIAAINEEIELLGPVDLESIREFAELNQRYDFLHGQYQDLCEARDSLYILLKETEKLMEKDFAHFFLLASESFHQTFTEIFRGGEASLRLESSPDRLEAGVNIEVKLPGKKAQGLNLLSGGERALTCMAFVFSLLRLKPVPFCILDEIDASLDDSNLHRFTAFIKTMADDVQFIVITHRQSTIESGEMIYGITMPENGVSSVLTLDLREASDLAG